MPINIFNVISAVFIIAGLFFIVVGTIGLLRLPDFYSRMHATGKCDTLGVGLTIIGLMIYNGLNFISVKLLFLVIFIFIVNPVATHTIARAAHKVGLQVWRKQ